MMTFSLPVLHDHVETKSVCFAIDVSLGMLVRFCQRLRLISFSFYLGYVKSTHSDMYVS